LASFLWGLLGGFVAFIAATIAGQPLYLFINLRSETASAIARYERFHTLIAPLEKQWLANRRVAYEVCGSRLVALASTNVFLTKILNKCGFDLQSAGDDLLILAQTVHGQSDTGDVQTRVVNALKLKLYPL
jgi:hypothetical protein